MKAIDDDSPIRESIQFFNDLSNEEKAIIVSDLHPDSFRLKKYVTKLAPLMTKILRDLGKFADIKIGNELMELGLEETYARLIVANMKKQVPTLSYHVSEVRKIDDAHFSENFEKILIAMWINDEDEKTITERYGINHDQFRSILGLTSHFIHALFRGDTTEKKIRDILVKHGLSETKSQTILKGMQPHKEVLYSRSMFSDLQDTLANTLDIKEQNDTILRGINQIIALLKSLPTKRGYGEE